MDGPGRTFTHHGQWPINGTGPPGTPTLNMDIFPPPAALNLRLTCPKLIVARFSFITQNIFHLLIYMVYYIDTASYIIFFNRVLYLFFFFFEHIQFGPSRRVSISLDIFRASLRGGGWRVAALASRRTCQHPGAARGTGFLTSRDISGSVKTPKINS